VFVSVGWEELHNSCTLRCLATVVADHCPSSLTAPLSQGDGRGSSSSDSG
jgi:hypothetical protein